MVHAYNSSAATRYRENSIEWVNIISLDPCDEICEPMVDDNPYPREEAATLLSTRTLPN